MRVLGIETTCDETGAAVVEDPSTHSASSVQTSSGRVIERRLNIISNVVASSVDLQKKYGGVVPEVAAREQVRSILPVIAEAIGNTAQITKSKLQYPNNLSNPKITKWAKESIDAIAVAHGPGLIGSLLIGVETAKALAIAWDKPLVAVNHLVGHIYANWIGEKSRVKSRKSKVTFPLVALVVSGGHTDLVLMTDHGKFKLLGSTLDDAAGEAFDKVAKLLGLGYPGGPEIERVAGSLSKATRNQKPVTYYQLPRPMINSKSFDFSFSGLKTAVVNRVQGLELRVKEKSEIAAEFQQAAIDVLVKKTLDAANKFDAKTIVVGGGVAANSELRSRMSDAVQKLAIDILFPQKDLAIDNGAMVAAAAFFNFKKVDPLKLAAVPSLHF